jgi:AraC-like DNA-binding protein
VRAETGVSRRRLATLRRFRRTLGQLASKTLPLSDLALDAGYFDQSHLSAACRIFAGKPPGALRALSIPRRFDLSLQDTRLKDRLRLVIDE